MTLRLRTALKLITAPTVEPLTLADAKQHLRVYHTDDDTRIGQLITAARMHLDGKDGLLQRCLVPQTWELSLDRFPSYEIRIPLPPLLTIVSVKYDDAAGAEQTVSSSDYAVDTTSEPGWIAPVSGKSWPGTFESLYPVRIRFTAGYTGGNPEDGAGVPKPLREALKLGVEALYDGLDKWPEAAMALIAPFEVWAWT